MLRIIDSSTTQVWIYYLKSPTTPLLENYLVVCHPQCPPAIIELLNLLGSGTVMGETLTLVPFSANIHFINP